MPIKVAAKFCAPHSYCKYLCKVFDIMSAFNAYQLQLKLCQSFWFSCADKCRLRVPEPQTRRRRERGIQHMANAVNYAMISMFQPTCFYGAHTLSVFGQFTTRPAANKLPIPICTFPIEFPTTLELKTKAKIRTVCRNGNATKGKQSWRQLKKAVLFYLFISVVAPKTFLISHYFLAAL